MKATFKRGKGKDMAFTHTKMGLAIRENLPTIWGKDRDKLFINRGRSLKAGFTRMSRLTGCFRDRNGRFRVLSKIMSSMAIATLKAKGRAFKWTTMRARRMAFSQWSRKTSMEMRCHLRVHFATGKRTHVQSVIPRVSECCMILFLLFFLLLKQIKQKRV